MDARASWKDRLRRVIRRRTFLKHGLLGLAVYFVPIFRWGRASGPERFLRPPGAIREDDFLEKCLRCGLCGEVCPNLAIKFFDIGEGAEAGTPYIVPREQACMLCMKCNHVCPSGSLTPIERDLKAILSNVQMGKAAVDKNLCYSYNNRPCGVCYRACPLQDVALKVGLYERPIVIAENCVGCGCCERICIHYPQAIRITPSDERIA